MKVIHLRIRGMKTIRITDGGMFLCQSFVPEWTGWQVCQDEIESNIEHFNIPPLSDIENSNAAIPRLSNFKC